MAYDFDLYVIGAGSGGVRAARFAAGFGASGIGAAVRRGPAGAARSVAMWWFHAAGYSA